MDDWGKAQFSRCAHYRSKVLERFLIDISTTATALVDCGSEHVAFTTISNDATDVPRTIAGSPSTQQGRETVRHGQLIRLSDDDAVRFGFAAHTLPRTEASFPNNWHMLSVELTSGFCDRLALQLDPGEDKALTENYLTRVWPILRQDCLTEAQSANTQTGTSQTAGWSLLDKVHIAVFVLDENGLMYRLNLAARNVLRDGDLLRRGRGGLFATNDADTGDFRAALKELGSEPESQSTDRIVFLRDRSDDRRVPLTLERYHHDGKPTQFIVATLPISPSSRRVRALAQNLGLTASEAKVAALIQRGLSNRDAAALAGLKEQTFNTYAKRVLSKLDVKCRSEMARLLTWQASGGGMQ